MGREDTRRASQRDRVSEGCHRSDDTFRQKHTSTNAPFYEAGTIRTARRQHLVAHLWECGARPVLEAILAIDAGAPMDHVLEDFARLPATAYHVLGADLLPKDRLRLLGDAS